MSKTPTAHPVTWEEWKKAANAHDYAEDAVKDLMDAVPGLGWQSYALDPRGLSMEAFEDALAVIRIQLKAHGEWLDLTEAGAMGVGDE